MRSFGWSSRLLYLLLPVNIPWRYVEDTRYPVDCNGHCVFMVTESDRHLMVCLEVFVNRRHVYRVKLGSGARKCFEV